MPVDVGLSLKEMRPADDGTRSGLLVWKSGILDEIIIARLGKTTFTINADEPSDSDRTSGLGWLISLTVSKPGGKQLYAVTLDGAKPSDRQGADLLSEVWKLATADTRRTNAERLRPVVESLRSAIDQASNGSRRVG